MSTLPLEILTPEREFFSGEAEGLIVTLSDGLYTILAGHAPMVAALDVGELRFKRHGQWHECAATEGFLEVTAEGQVLVFSQACELAEEIDAARASAAAQRAKDRLASSRSLHEYELSRIALTRAMNRLRVTSRGRYIK